jgi:NAD(P)-dependent dehydrogenase (short-subunit alcohol dehydrogenase family)
MSPLKRYTGKHALVTGAGSGLGRAIAQRLAAEGAQVTIVELLAETAEKTAQEIRAAGGSARVFQADVGDTEAMRRVFDQVDQLDVLVNNAGISHVGNALTTSPEDLDRVYHVNVRGVFHGLHFGIPKMLAGRGGAILNLASVVSKLGLQDRLAYSMSKGAVLTMTLSAARDFIGRGIRCNCVCPGRVHTPFVDAVIAKNFPGREKEGYEKLARSQPIGRMGRPEEVAALAAYLCSDEASFVTGSAYDIDGGMTLLC